MSLPQGHVGEKILTVTPEAFEKFKTGSNFSETERKAILEEPLAYSYLQVSLFDHSCIVADDRVQHEGLIMRSQIDCQDPRLPRKTFDIKTRATISVRLDRLNHEVRKLFISSCRV